MKLHVGPQMQITLSLAVGLMAAAAAWHIMAEKEKNLTSKYQMTTVLVARRFIPAGKTITEDCLEEKKVPIAYLEPKALSRWEPLNGGKEGLEPRAIIGILKGEQLTRSKVTDTKAHVGLAWSLAPGQEAMSLRFSIDESVGGFIRPGDWVSIYGVKDRARLILPRIQVLAVKDRLDESEPVPLRNEDSPNDNNSLLLTLSVVPKEAALLALAAQKGKLHLTLLSSLEEDVPEPVSATQAELGM